MDTDRMKELLHRIQNEGDAHSNSLATEALIKMDLSLSEEAKAKYLRNPNHCPYCLSSDIEGGQIDWDDPISLVHLTFSEKCA
ncbi:hypothetical protein LCGC14_1962620, partial [marine sediment metagenome]